MVKRTRSPVPPQPMMHRKCNPFLLLGRILRKRVAERAVVPAFVPGPFLGQPKKGGVFFGGFFSDSDIDRLGVEHRWDFLQMAM